MAKFKPLAYLIPIGLLWAIPNDLDLWWHIKTGEIMWQTKQILREDIYTYTILGKPWVNHEWLSQLILYPFWKLGGNVGIIILRMLVGCALFGITLRTATILSGSYLTSLFCTTFAFWVATSRLLLDRPGAFSTLLFVLTLSLCLGVRKKIFTRKVYLWLFPCFLLWANLHGGVIVGLIMLLVFWAFAIWQRRKESTTIDFWLREEVLWPLLVLTVLCNPFGYKVLTFPFENWGLSLVRQHTMEWLSAFEPWVVADPSGRWIPVILLGLGISLLLAWKTSDMAYLIIIGIFILLAAKAIRFTTDLAFLSAPFLAQILGRLQHWRLGRWHLGSTTLLFGNLALLVPLGNHIWQRGPLSNQELILAQSSYPNFSPDLMEFLERNQIQGRVFNEMHLASSFIFFRGPKEKVFFDTRHSLYGDLFYQQYRLALIRPEAFEKLDTKYNFDYAILANWELSHSGPLRAYLRSHPKWALIYSSNKGYIFVKRSK